MALELGEVEVEVVQEAQKGLFGRLRAAAQVRARVRPTAPRPKRWSMTRGGTLPLRKPGTATWFAIDL